MTRRWQCTVCGYIHVGAEPPESCPVCGADRSQFVPIEDQQAAALPSLIATFKLHPVAAHFPNGLLPTAAFSLLLYLVRGNPGFETTAFWLLMGATAVIPVSLGSGLHDWRQHFGGRRAPIFFKKIGLAVTLLMLGLVAIALRYGQPELLATGGWQRWLFLVCLGGMLGCVMLLGHYVFIKNLSEGKPAPGFTDVFFCPLFVGDLGELLLKVLKLELRGIYHVVGSESLSKYDFGLSIARRSGLDERLIEPVSVEESTLKARRSHNLRLSVHKLSTALGEPIPGFSTGLDRFYTQYQQGYPQKMRSYQQA